LQFLHQYPGHAPPLINSKSNMSLQEHTETNAAPAPPKAASQAPSSARKRWQRLKLALGVIAVVAAVEPGVRAISAITHRIPVFVSDERAGWANRHNLRNEIRVGDGGRFAISTDGEGYRLTRGLEEPPADDQRAVIVAGDSFAFGQGVNDSESFCWILSHVLDRKVVNQGVFGYGTDQQLIRLSEYLEKHPDQRIGDVVVLVLDNDMTDVQLGYLHYLGRSKPLFELADDKLIQPAYRPNLSDRLMDMSYAYWLFNGKLAIRLGTTKLDPAAGIPMVVACLETMREKTLARGGRFHVLAHHYIGRQPPFSESAWQDFLVRVGATDLTPRLLARGDRDLLCYDEAHWNPKGHRMVAELVREKLEADNHP
jgi:hypothetical protein